MFEIDALDKQWRNRRGGQSTHQRLVNGRFLLTYREKRGKEKKVKRGDGEEKKENYKIKGKVEN